MMIRLQPFYEIDTVRQYLDRVINETVAAPSEPKSEPINKEWKPATEIYDDGKHLILRVLVPGIAAKDIDIQVTKESVEIAGERHVEKQPNEYQSFWSEIRYGKFHRVINLPVAVQNDQVKADYTNGVLTLTLPKADVAKVFKVNLGKSISTISEKSPEAHDELDHPEW